MEHAYKLNLVTQATAAFNCRTCTGQRADQWYHDMGLWIRRQARKHGVDVGQAMAGFAVLSTNSTVDLNMRNFTTWLEGKPVKHFGDVKRRLRLIKRGDINGGLSYKRGRKIVSFYGNLRYPRRPSETPTIDRHAARILFGVENDDAARLGKNLLAQKRGYAIAARVYRDVAREVGLRPHELQAITWCHLVNCKNEDS
ncbi:DUF7178 family protein [Porticoccus sp.]